MRHVIPIVLIAFLSGFAAADQDVKPPIVSVVPTDTLAFIHVDVAALAAKESIASLAEQFAAAQGKKLSEMSADVLGSAITDVDGFCLLMGNGFNVVAIRTRKAYDRDKVIEALAPGTKEQTYKGKKYYGQEPKLGGRGKLYSTGAALLFLDEQTYVSGRVGQIQHFIDKSAKPDEEVPLLAAYRKARAHQFTIAAAPPSDMVKEMKEEMRSEVRSDPLRAMAAHALLPLLEARRFVLTADADDVSKLEVSLSFADAADAAKAPDALNFGLRLLAGGVSFLEEEMTDLLSCDSKSPMKKVRELMEEVRSGLRSATVLSEGRHLRVSLEAKTGLSLVKAVVVETLPHVQLAANRSISANNLKQLGVALHSYCLDNQDNLPPAWGTIPPSETMFDKEKKPLGLSWRVHLLPYLEQAHLYKRFKLNESWDSEHNKKLIPLMPKLFESVSVRTREKGLTFYQAVTTESTGPVHSVFPTGPLPRDMRRYKIGTIPDGTSNTLLFVEAAEPVIWTKPDDITYDGKEKLLPKLGGMFKDGFNALHCDGSVQFFRKKDVTERFLKLFVGSDDGEVIEFPGDRKGPGSSDSAPGTANERPKEPPPDRKPKEK